MGRILKIRYRAGWLESGLMWELNRLFMAVLVVWRLRILMDSHQIFGCTLIPIGTREGLLLQSWYQSFCYCYCCCCCCYYYCTDDRIGTRVSLCLMSVVGSLKRTNCLSVLRLSLCTILKICWETQTLETITLEGEIWTCAT